MKKTFYLLALIAISSVYSQNRISISVLGGSNYIPMNKFYNFINSFENSYLDKFSFSGNIKIQYNFSVKHNIFIGIEYINTTAAIYNCFLSANYTFSAIPICLGYEYSFKSIGKYWSPYFGIGISYVVEKMEDRFRGDVGAGVLYENESTYGFENKIGIEIDLLKNLFAVAELKYRYIGNTNLTNTVDINLSGVGFLLGIKFKLL